MDVRDQLQRARDILDVIYEARAVRGSGGMEARGGVKGKAKNFGKYNRSGTKKYKKTGKKKGISSQQRSAQAMERNRRNMPKVKSKKQTTGGDIVPYRKNEIQKAAPKYELDKYKGPGSDIVPAPRSSPRPSPRKPGRTRPSLPSGRTRPSLPQGTGSVREPVKNAIQVYKNGETKKAEKKKEEKKSLPKRPQSREEKLRLDFQKTKVKKYAPAPVVQPSSVTSKPGVAFVDPDEMEIR